MAHGIIWWIVVGLIAGWASGKIMKGGGYGVIGDMIIIMDSNFNVLWTWDAFDHLDVTRTAILGETCRGSGACMSHFLAPDGNHPSTTSTVAAPTLFKCSTACGICAHANSSPSSRWRRCCSRGSCHRIRRRRPKPEPAGRRPSTYNSS